MVMKMYKKHRRPSPWRWALKMLDIFFFVFFCSVAPNQNVPPISAWDYQLCGYCRKIFVQCCLSRKGQTEQALPCVWTFSGKLKAWKKYTFLNENLCFAQLLGKYHIFHPLHKEVFIAVTTHIEFNIHWGCHEVHRTESYKL